MFDLLAAGLGSHGTFPTSESSEPGTALRSLDFLRTTAMRDNDKDWTSDGKAFPLPDWTIDNKGKTRSGAISHTMGQQIDVELALDVTPERRPCGGELTGKGISPFLDFEFSGVLSGGEGKRLRMTAQNKLPDEVAAYPRRSIDWTIKWGGWKHQIGRTGRSTYTPRSTSRRAPTRYDKAHGAGREDGFPRADAEAAQRRQGRHVHLAEFNLDVEIRE